jgi:hypothetical protein
MALFWMDHHPTTIVNLGQWKNEDFMDYLTKGTGILDKAPVKSDFSLSWLKKSVIQPHV